MSNDTPMTTCVSFDCLSNASAFMREAKPIAGPIGVRIIAAKLILILRGDCDATSDRIETLADKHEGILGCWEGPD